MKLNEQQEKILKKSYDYIEAFIMPKEQPEALRKSAEYGLVLETIKALEGIKVAYNNAKK